MPLAMECRNIFFSSGHQKLIPELRKSSQILLLLFLVNSQGRMATDISLYLVPIEPPWATAWPTLTRFGMAVWPWDH
jgi:hypothetical protein